MDKQLVVADPNEVPGDVALAPPGVMGPRQGTDDAVAFSAECVDPQPRMALRTHVETGQAWGEERARLLAKHDELRKKQAALRARLDARMRKLEEVHAALMAVIMDQWIRNPIGETHGRAGVAFTQRRDAQPFVHGAPAWHRTRG